MKKKRWIILILFFLLTALLPAFADEPHIAAEVDERMMQLYTVNLTLDNQYMTSDVPPVLFEYQDRYRTLVPVAAIAVYAGADVSWDEERQEVTITRDDKTILLKINSAAVMVNGEEKTLPSQVPAKIITFQNRGRTMVPVAFIAQELGLEVAWDEAARTVRITTPAAAVNEPVQPVTPGNLPPVSDEFQGELLSLSDISISLNGDLPEIRLKTGGKTLFSSMRLVSPDRLVFDLHNALLMITDPHKLQPNNTIFIEALENPYLESVRSSQFEINPSTVRLVFDMKASADYQVAYDEHNNEMVIRLLTDSTDSTNSPVTQTNKLIVIDPGHGGSDPGAIFPQLNLYEKNIVLAVAKQTKSLLETAGFQVTMTRSDDSYVSLFDRVEIANQLQADLFVSIHVNAATQGHTKGVETIYYPSEKDPEDFRENRALAAIFHEEVTKALGAYSFRIDARENLIVLRETKMPAVLTELGFVTNPDEERLLATAGYHHSAAEGIFNAVMRYFK